MPKVFVHRGLGKRSLWTEIAYFQWFLLRQAGRHDFPEKPEYFFVAKRTFISLKDRAQDLSFSLRAIIVYRCCKLTF